jgi:ferredoxin
MAASKLNTLEYNEGLCNSCGMCAVVCPHRVFQNGVKAQKARLVEPDSCMECGACALNCKPGAIKVDSSVGCAQAMMKAALLGSKAPASCCS